MSRSSFWRPRTSFVLVLSALVAMALSASAAWAGPGYRLDSVNPSIPLGAQVPIGVAIDQSSQAIYVAEVSRDLFKIQPGQVEQLSASGTPTASSPFGTGGQDFFMSVAVNPVTHDVYAYQIEALKTPGGPKGTSKVTVFSSSGAMGASISPGQAEAQSLAADSSGRLFFPSSTTDSVRIYSAAGALEGSVTCATCPGAPFVDPQSVAFDPAGKLYVVDRANGGRALEFTPSGGSYVYESTLQIGAGAVAVGVDGASGDVFVGDLVSGKYHVVAYDSSGVPFDDFGAGLVSPSDIDEVTGQLAVNATTHRLYLSNPGGNNLRVFERIGSIPAPTASAAAPTPIGQLEATLRATVNPKGHVLTSCGFEYTDHADFLANGYANAKTASCPAVVGDNESVSITANVKGLAPETSYDYRVKIASFGGAAETSNQTFQTLPPLPPEAITGAASALTKTTATLGGTVNPKGGTVSNCHFEYVTEAGFQSDGFAAATSRVCTTTPSGNAPNAVSAKASGLTGNTAYRFRVVVTSNAGTTTAAEKTFATLAETCAENPTFCPPPETPPAGSAPAQVETGPVASPPPPVAPTARKPLKCRKGFKKKKVRGKLKCVRAKSRRRR